MEKHLLFDKADQALLLCERCQLLVVLKLLSSRLGDQDVVTEIECLGSDREVGGVGGKDNDGGALGKSAERLLVCFVSS